MTNSSLHGNLHPSAPLLKDACILLAAVFLIFGGYFFLGLGSIHPDVQGDFKIYLGMAQSIDSGQVLYQGASDTKNMGFFAFFVAFYKLYTLFAGDLASVYLWAHTVLTLVYFCSALMIYLIIKNLIQSRIWALGTALFFLLYISLLEHAYILNQPQIALLWVLGILLFLSKERPYGKGSFFLLGVLLGGAFACSSPYIILALIIPFLSLRRKPKPLVFLTECLLAFAGFLIILLSFFIYFWYAGALDDWFYWNVQFLSVYGERGIKIPLPLVKASIGAFFTLSNHPQTILMFCATAGASALWLIRGTKILSKNDSSRAILAFSLLTLLARLLLDKHHSSYNFYHIPFLIVVPSLLLWPIKKPILWVGIGLWALLTLKSPASYLDTFPSPLYEPQTRAVLRANGGKKPVYTASPGLYSYIKGVSTEYAFYFSSARIIAKRRPELVFGKPEPSDYLQALGHPRPYEQKLLQDYPMPLEDFFAQNYTQITPILYVRNDALGQWNPPADAPADPDPWMQKRLKLPDYWKQKIKEIFKQ